jgi:hypothetical protein
LTRSSTHAHNLIGRSEEGVMPKMYRIVDGNSATWEYVDAKKNNGDPDPGDKELARSKESWATEDEAVAAINEMKTAPIKRKGKPPGQEPA